MQILRTPDARFADLEDFPFAPCYTTIQTADESDLRIHHVDEGPAGGPIVICFHGEPAWSYVYRKMIPILTEAGLRVIAPDLPGFGKSDKPAAREDYTYQCQVDWMNAWLVANDFKGATFFGQDWGGMIGLRVVADHPDRFDRVVISNTGLTVPGAASQEEIRAVEALKADPKTPSLVEMARALREMSGDDKLLKFATWQKFSWETEDLPVGLMMYAGTTKQSRASTALHMALSKIGLGKIATSEIRKAYEAPYPDVRYKMGARAMPSQAPLLPGDPSTEAQLRAWSVFDTFDKPFLCAFSDDDPITGSQEAEFRRRIPGAQGQPHTTIAGGGHFVQENAPQDISRTIIEFIAATPAVQARSLDREERSAMTTTVIDKDAIRKKYAEEREKRLRPDGNAQYKRLDGSFESPAADPYTPRVERAPVTDHVTFAFVGGGLSGLVTGARLKEAGVEDVRLIDKGGDFGGTWYWNRYPGVQCDTVSLIYLPLLEETGYVPTEKYVHGPEIREHCARIADQYGLREKALFHTGVTTLEWQETDKRWLIKTDRGDAFTAKYVGAGTGPLSVPKLPGIPGLERFKGVSFHTSRWDYAYTGGDPEGALMDKLADKRVAVIGTGATGIQCIPYLAKTAMELYVFQRTPSSVDERNNSQIDPDWFQSMAAPGWQQRWYDNFVDNQSRGVIPTEDLVNDGWTAISRRIREKVFGLPPDKMTPENMLAAVEESDMEKMSDIRARVDDLVQDKDTAAKLKAWYSQLCKRPTFSDIYLDAFNQPNVILVDTDGQGVSEVTETGLIVDGMRYDVDCIIYASGFEFGADFRLESGFDLKGLNGEMLSAHWADGLRTLHGLQMHGFPNAFMVQMNQAANLASNIPHNIADHAKTIAQVVSHAEANGFAEVQPTPEAEAAWVELVLTSAGSLISSPDCTPGFWNNEGQGWDERFRQAQGHPGGPRAFFEHMKAWRAAGAFDGLAFR